MRTDIDRAKQFLPFAALKGFEEALRKKEKELESISKYSLSEDRIDNIIRKLNSITNNDLVSIKYFNNNRYISNNTYISIIVKIFYTY